MHANTHVLYITPLWSGMKDYFLEGKTSVSGMPAFFKPFARLTQDPRINHLTMIIFIRGPHRPIRMPTHLNGKVTVIPLFYRSTLGYLSQTIAAFFRGLWISVTRRIHVIFGHGSEGHLAGWLGLVSRRPNVRRIYGTFMNNESHCSRLSLFMKHPFEYLAFRLPGKGVIITNDGTHGDTVFKKIGHPKTPLYFWLNGVEKNLTDQLTRPDLPLPPTYMTYIARISDWKRQHLIIEAISALNQQEKWTVPVYLVGPVTDSGYYHSLQKAVSDYNLGHLVHFVPPLPREEVLYLMRHSSVTFSLYHTSNLGNVFLEALRLGTPMVAINENQSLDGIPDTAFVSLPNSDTAPLVDAIQQLIASPDRRKTLSKCSTTFAKTQLDCWSDRVEKEIQVLLQ